MREEVPESGEGIMKKKNRGWKIGVLFAAGVFLTGCNLETGKHMEKPDPKHPVTITVWNYYNGAQMEAFENLVEEFNETEGQKQGIYVDAHSMGNVSELENNVLDAVKRKVGASELPNIFAAYADTAYAVDQLGYVVDLRPYLSEKEQSRFVESYLEEGAFSNDGSLKIFPVAKSTEIFVLNKTDWDRFSESTGASLDELKTVEGITQTAQAYYEWTDSLTPEPNDGKAFFGRDAMANYILTGARQLGVEIFSIDKETGDVVLNFDHDVMRKLWDNYYIPFVKGYFGESGRFRSDDIKTGNLISFIGSSSGSSFFPDEVILSDSERYPIEMEALECPKFENSENFAVQQGAGMVVTKTDEKSIYASVEFLKWFTQDDRNIQFSVASGYLPVTREANNAEKIRSEMGDETQNISVLTAAVDTVNHNRHYTMPAFENGTDARNVLQYTMSDRASADRQVVLERMRNGMSLEEATESFVSDDWFENWYQSVKTQLENLIK